MLRGSGRGAKKAIANWFNEKSPEKLALQVVKYKQRDGWSMRDVLRVSHPKAATPSHNSIYHYVTKGWDAVGNDPHSDAALNVIWASERAKVTTDEKEIARLVRDFALPWEAIDTKWLNSHLVWDALMENIMPEALMRNLGRLTSNGYLKAMSDASRKAIGILTSEDRIKQARLHPMKLLVALKIYAQGRGDKGSLTWTPNQQIVNALDDAHYMAYQFVEPTNKRHLLALDISGSMDSPVPGMPITAREAVAAMAMVTARVEKEHLFVGFGNTLVNLPISPRQRLDDVCKLMQRLPFGYTNVALPFEWALQSKTPLDAVIVMSDNEVNYGQHPATALNRYRKEMGLATKLVVCGTSTTSFTVNDPTDPNGLDVVGFDTAAPQIMADFIGDRFDKAQSENR
jgi:60 kDa SS-A/Ro ribonucleoprotein